jgi:hypothetical protein
MKAPNKKDYGCTFTVGLNPNELIETWESQEARFAYKEALAEWEREVYDEEGNGIEEEDDDAEIEDYDEYDGLSQEDVFDAEEDDDYDYGDDEIEGFGDEEDDDEEDDWSTANEGIIPNTLYNDEAGRL